MAAEPPDACYEVLLVKRHVRMRFEFPPPYEGKRLTIYRSGQPGREECISAGIGPGCVENFVGAVAVVMFDVHRSVDGKPAAASIREVVTVVEQSEGLPQRPPFVMTIKLDRGIGSDLQAFGYDEASTPPAERAAQREQAMTEWRRYRQELYLGADKRPFAVVNWLHTTARIRLLSVHSEASLARCAE